MGRQVRGLLPNSCRRLPRSHARKSSGGGNHFLLCDVGNSCKHHNPLIYCFSRIQLYSTKRQCLLRKFAQCGILPRVFSGRVCKRREVRRQFPCTIINVNRSVVAETLSTFHVHARNARIIWVLNFGYRTWIRCFQQSSSSEPHHTVGPHPRGLYE